MTVAPNLPWLALRVAGLSTAVSVVVGLWRAWTLANREFAGKRVLGALATAALALPAPLLCYYLLCVLGRVWSLTETGLVAAGVLSAMPLLIRASRPAFASLDPDLAKAARHELLRLAIPRRVYTQSHIDYVVEAILEVNARKQGIRGMEIVYEPPFLRHFSARFRQL